MTLDVAIFVILSPVLSIERVLPREESAMFKNYSIGIGENGNGLRPGAERILECYIFRVKVVASNIGAVCGRRRAGVFVRNAKRQYGFLCIRADE